MGFFVVMLVLLFCLGFLFGFFWFFVVVVWGFGCVVGFVVGCFFFFLVGWVFWFFFNIRGRGQG